MLWKSGLRCGGETWAAREEGVDVVVGDSSTVVRATLGVRLRCFSRFEGHVGMRDVAGPTIVRAHKQSSTRSWAVVGRACVGGKNGQWGCLWELFLGGEQVGDASRSKRGYSERALLRAG
jgi:hypothetical protein